MVVFEDGMPEQETGAKGYECKQQECVMIGGVVKDARYGRRMGSVDPFYIKQSDRMMINKVRSNYYFHVLIHLPIHNLSYDDDMIVIMSDLPLMREIHVFNESNAIPRPKYQ